MAVFRSCTCATCSDLFGLLTEVDLFHKFISSYYMYIVTPACVEDRFDALEIMAW